MIEWLRWCISAAALLWMILLLGFAVLALAERTEDRRVRSWPLAWLAGAAASAPILYIACRVFPFSALTAICACTAVAAILWLIAWRMHGKTRLTPAPRCPWQLLLAVLLISLTLAAAYVELQADNDIYATAVRDWNGRQAVVWSLRQFGLPLQDVLFYPGQSVEMYYPAGAYLAVAAAADAAGPTVPDAWPFALFMAITFASLCLLAAEWAGRMFASSRAAGWAVVLVCVGGLDVLVNIALKLTGEPVSLGHVGAWANPSELRIDGLYTAALWAVPHLLAAGAVFLVMRWLPLHLRRRGGACLAAAIVTAGVFYFSPYVALAGGAVIGLWTVAIALRRCRRRTIYLASLLIVCVLAAALAYPWIRDLRAMDTAGAKSKLEFHLPSPSIHPVSWLIPGAAGLVFDMAVQLLLELSPVLILAALSWRFCRPQLRWRPQYRMFLLVIPMILAGALFVRSTGQINDWGVRVTHILQISAAILGGGFLATMKSSRRLLRLGVYALVLIGFGATAWQMGSANFGRVVMTTPDRRFPLFQASRYIRDNTPPGAIVMFAQEIDGANYARRWCGRRALLVNIIHGSMAYADPIAMRELQIIHGEIADTGLDQLQASRLVRMGATVGLVPARLAHSDYAAANTLYRNEAFVVVDLKATAKN